MNSFCSIQEAVNELKEGKMLIVVDSSSRENQGDIVFPAQDVTVEKVNFAMKECRGMFCVPLTEERAVKLELPLMVSPIDNTEKLKCNFTVSVDAATVSSFGIAAADRAKTVKVIASPDSKPQDLVRPGHVFPIIAKDGGVLDRPGHTEATLELVQLAGFSPVGVLCEIIRDDGKVARVPDLIKFSKKFHLKIVSIFDLIKYVKAHPRTLPKKSSNLVRKATSRLPTRYGTFQVVAYKSSIDKREHVALVKGEKGDSPMLLRIHSQCLTGDTFFSLRCDCREQLEQSMKMINQKGRGIIIYLNQEGRGIGLSNKIKAYELQDKGLDTVDANYALDQPADARDYQAAAEILNDLGITKVILLTNNPHKIKEITSYGIDVFGRISLEVKPGQYNRSYLAAKKNKLGHKLEKV